MQRKRNTFARLGAAVFLFTAGALFAVGMTVSGVRAEEDKALFSVRMMTPDVALKAALGALASCREQGYQAAAAVVDRSGTLQVLLRDRYAGPHTPEAARRKAWTAVTFRTTTTELAELSAAGKSQAGLRDITGALALGGGMMIEAAGALVGGIGVSGAPGGAADDSCAAAGIAAIEDELAFQ